MILPQMEVKGKTLRQDKLFSKYEESEYSDFFPVGATGGGFGRGKSLINMFLLM